MPSRPVVLVTGAARRIGREIALELARGGHDVAAHGRRIDDDLEHTVDTLRSIGARAHAFEADLADEGQCRALVPAVVERFGSLRAVVNNAAVFEPDSAVDATLASMERHWRANTAPAVLLAQALYVHLEAAFGRTTDGATGCVVQLLDQKLSNPNPDYFSYTLSKAALREATVLLAQALAPRVRVCGVAPGLTLPSPEMTAAVFERAHRMTPLGRSSMPEDIARAVRFLVESPAITGEVLRVDGGQHLSPQPRDVLHLAQA